MIEIQIRETDEFIKLGQALKKPDLWNPVLMQNLSSRDGLVKVNGETELQRGKKNP